MSNVRAFPDAPVASPAEVRARTNLVIQAWRFALLNAKMIAMVTKGHH